MKQVFKLYYDFNKTQLRIIEELENCNNSGNNEED